MALKICVQQWLCNLSHLHITHQLLWVQGYWQVQHLPVQVHGDGQDGPRELKLGV